ncbi:hypothetical protein L6164_034948 [Bauhinia variegata]|uniref:Uncharacterized protein n=1 Tax=Bauhinia variegata TaxID=167791 RepID=A0ACB9KWF9_BAUVA|nr:hypothetical protein L6164_034948 [Bauhinia variegata]
MQRKFPESGNKASDSLVPSNANAIVSTISPHAKQCSFDDSENFYEKLNEFLESSGFSLVFDFRPQVLDLYLLYLEVNRRGGYHQVSKDGKWDELVSALKLESENNAKLPTQLEKLYANLLYKIVEEYCNGSPKKLAGAHEISGLQTHTRHSTKKRRNSNQDTIVGSSEHTLLLLPSETNKREGPPIKPRNCYQIFLRNECTNLNGKGKLSRAMATAKWKNMSAIERQEYVQLSILDKERYIEEMEAFKLQNTTAGKERGINGDGDYRVTQPDAESTLLVPNNSALMDLALIKALKPPGDSFDWYG